MSSAMARVWIHTTKEKVSQRYICLLRHGKTFIFCYYHHVPDKKIDAGMRFEAENL
uniref:Uncharacterized protein n=1 Tax=Setaria italica TaxID=4555 RepID=K3ZKY4_SETIT